jgi:hypothetical protein
MMTAEEFAARIEKLIGEARDEGLSDEAMVTELDAISEALSEGLS